MAGSDNTLERRGGFGLAPGGIPAAVAVSVLRYGLYEIDRIVSRTVSDALVIGMLAAVFFGVVGVLTSLLPSESDLAVAGSTLVVAALFNRLRKRSGRRSTVVSTGRDSIRLGCWTAMRAPCVIGWTPKKSWGRGSEWWRKRCSHRPSRCGFGPADLGALRSHPGRAWCGD